MFYWLIEKCKVIPEIINIKSNNLHFIATVLNKCSGSGNNINDRYTKMCVPEVLKI